MNSLRLSALVCSVAAILPGALSGGLAPNAAGPATPTQAQSPLHDIGHGRPPTRELNTLKDLADALNACWKAPAQYGAPPGMEITVLFSLARDGEIMGEPLLTFESPDTPADMRETYQHSIIEAFRVCAPFRLSASLGNTIAGRPHSLRLIHRRGQIRT